MSTTSLLQLLEAITRKGSEIGVKLVASGGRTPAPHFDFDQQGIDCGSMPPTKVSVHTAERGFFEPKVSSSPARE
jgi:hypothetical protein